MHGRAYLLFPFALSALVCLSGCVERAPVPSSLATRTYTERATVEKPRSPTQTMVTSYYGRNDGFDGKLTASGERFDANRYTAAHRTLPFGTRVKLKNPKNGAEVTVAINDRGPHVAGRDLDIAYAAAKRLGIVEAGIAPLEATIIPGPE